MKRIQNANGYAVYQAGDRDVTKYGFESGSFYVFFASDIRDFGIENSDPEFEGLGSIEEALSCCSGNYARAREIVESLTTAATYEEIAEVERQLDDGEIGSDGEPLTSPAEDEEEPDQISSTASGPRQQPDTMKGDIRTMSTAAMNIAAKITERGTTIEAIATRVGMSADCLRKSLKGERRLMADELVTLCQVLGMNLGDLRRRDEKAGAPAHRRSNERSTNMIDINKLKQYMSERGVPSYDALADLIEEDPAYLRAFIAAEDMPVSMAKAISDALAIHSTDYEAVFFARSNAGPAPSEYSSRAGDLDEAEILGNYREGQIVGVHNVLDDLLAAWQLTEQYNDIDIPAALRIARAEACSATAKLDPEEAAAALEDAATMHGFALGVQFAIQAMRGAGDLADIIRAGI